MTPDDDRDERLDSRPCPACPDGSRWTREGPMGTCPVCKGFGAVKMSGEAFTEWEWRSMNHD